MNRKLLTAAVQAVATSLTTPLLLADRGDRGRDNNHREMRAHQTQERFSHRDSGRHHDRHQDKHQFKHYKKHGGHHDFHGRREHVEYSPRVYRNHDDYYPQRRSSSSAPIILGGVVGGVVGHHIGYGDPGHTAVGAVIGTIIGYDIARHRNR